jgi:hypothetical protein
MFIIDEFLFLDEHGQPTGRTLEPQESYLLAFSHRLPFLSILILRLEVARMSLLGRESGKYILA